MDKVERYSVIKTIIELLPEIFLMFGYKNLSPLLRLISAI
jgi:hypothetical protein